MGLPQPDESAYSGDIVVKSVTYGKSNKGRTSGIGKVRRAIDALQKEADARLTIDRLDPTSDVSIEVQLLVNKGLAAELRKQILMLTTFIKNN